MKKSTYALLLAVLLTIGFCFSSKVAFAMDETSGNQKLYTKDTAPKAELINRNEKAGVFFHLESENKEASCDIIAGYDKSLYTVDSAATVKPFFTSEEVTKLPVFWEKPGIDEQGSIYAVSKSSMLYMIAKNGNCFITKQIDGYVENSLRVIDMTKLCYIQRIENKDKTIKLSFMPNLVILEQTPTKLEERKIPIGSNYFSVDLKNNLLYFLNEKGKLKLMDLTTEKSIFLGDEKNTYNRLYKDSKFHLFFLSSEKSISYFEKDDKIKSIPLSGYPLDAYNGTNGIYYVLLDKEDIVAVDLNSGKVLWTLKPPSKLIKDGNRVTVDESGNLYVICSDGFLYVYDVNGNLKWKYTMKSSFRSNPYDSGNGLVVLSLNGGTIDMLTKPDKPNIVDIRVSDEPTIGKPIGLLVLVRGIGPFTYQWRKDGVDIDGATSNKYIIPSAEQSDEGLYSVVVKNTFGTTVSQEGALKIKE